MYEKPDCVTVNSSELDVFVFCPIGYVGCGTIYCPKKFSKLKVTENRRQYERIFKAGSNCSG